MRRRIRFPVLAAAALAACGVLPAAMPAKAQPSTAPTSAAAGLKPLTLEAIFGPEGAVDFDGTYATGLAWLPDGSCYLERRDGQLQRIEPQSGAATPAFDRERLKAALIAGGVREDAAGRLADRPGRFTQDRAGALLEHDGKLLYYRFDPARLTTVLSDGRPRAATELSPRGNWVSFVRDNNLHVVATAGSKPRRLTADGGPLRLNGVLDWVYMEEVYGRGRQAAHWWSPDETRIAFLQFDETGVPEYTIVDESRRPAGVEKSWYPKAGDANPKVRLGVVRVDGGGVFGAPAIRWIDLPPSENGDLLIVRVGWAPDGRLLYQVQDREQRWLRLCEADPHTGRFRTLLTETSPAWVDVLDEPTFLADGSFLWRSANDGFAHLYHLTRDGVLVRRLTRGPWEVSELHGVDEAGGWVYFSGSRDSSVERHAYRVALGGGEPQRLTEPGFSHSVEFDPGCVYFIDTFSSAATPPRVHLRRGDGSLLRVISQNDVAVLREYRLATPEFLQVPARDGALLNAVLLRPPDFDPARKYPVWSYTYAGPQAPSVSNRWGGRNGLFNQYLAQQGYLIWVCDPRASGGHGAGGAWQSYQRLGEQELADLEDGIAWLVANASADPTRVGIHGHSYGGFMTAYALTHSDVFSVGIAGSGVFDWRNYDTIYTERYMRMPQNNPDGYERTSCVAAAKNLHGRLLIYHGAMDDNVHLQNAFELATALQKHGKLFDLMIYPQDRHGIGRGDRHLRELRLEYIERYLRGGERGVPGGSANAASLD